MSGSRRRSDTCGRRLAVLRRLAHPDPADPRTGPLTVVVTPIRGLLQPIVGGLGDIAPVSLRAGQAADLDDVLASLVEIGYTRTDLVERRGEIAVRGGIVDVFPPTEEHPLRVEFFGDEVEEIRQFRVADQRSLQTADGLWAPPCRELLLTPAVRDRAKQLADDHPGLADVLGKLADGIAVEGMEAFAPAIAARMELLLDYVPAGGRVLACDPERIRARAADLVRTSQEFLAASWVNAAAGGQVPIDLGAAAFRLHHRGPGGGRRPGAAVVDDHPVREPRRGRRGRPPALARDGAAGGRGRSDQAGRPALQHGGESRGGVPRRHRPGPRRRAPLAGGPVAGGAGHRGARARAAAGRDAARGWPRRPARRPGRPARARGALRHDRADRPGLHLGGGPAGGDLPRRTWPGSAPAAGTPGGCRAGGAAGSTRCSSRPGDYVVHEQHGVGRYLEMTSRSVQGAIREYLVIEYAPGKRGQPPDRLYVPTDQLDQVTRYVGGEAPALHRLGGADWAKTKGRARKAVRQIAAELIRLYSARMASPGHAFGPDTPWQRELEDAFPYVETPDQLGAIDEVKRDMERPVPMDRLICGDVGYGKTEIAVRAAFKAVQDGKQVAVLVPTTLLAAQHYSTFSERYAPFPVVVQAAVAVPERRGGGGRPWPAWPTAPWTW